MAPDPLQTFAVQTDSARTWDEVFARAEVQRYDGRRARSGSGTTHEAGSRHNGVPVQLHARGIEKIARTRRRPRCRTQAR